MLKTEQKPGYLGAYDSVRAPVQYNLWKRFTSIIRALMTACDISSLIILRRFSSDLGLEGYKEHSGGRKVTARGLATQSSQEKDGAIRMLPQTGIWLRSE